MHDLSKRYRLFAIWFGLLAGMCIAVTVRRYPTRTLFDSCVDAFVICSLIAQSIWFASLSVRITRARANGI